MNRPVLYPTGVKSFSLGLTRLWERLPQVRQINSPTPKAVASDRGSCLTQQLTRCNGSFRHGIFNFFAASHVFDEFLLRNPLHLKDLHRLEIVRKNHTKKPTVGFLFFRFHVIILL
jgi:hypothetical protein